MFNRIFRNHTVLSALLSFLYVFLALPISEAVAFTAPSDAAARHFMYLAKFIFFVLIFSVIRLIFYLVSNRKKLKSFTKWWFKYALISFGISLLLFILIYPGHWVWDEFNVLNQVKHYQPDAWQNILTNLYYTLCLYVYPTGVSIVFFQIVIVAIVTGYVLAVVRKHTKTPWVVYLLFIVFISPVMLINDLYPLRLTIYSFALLALLTLLVDSYLDKKLRNKPFLFVISSLLITILCFWRTEGIIYLLTLPLAAQRFGIISGIRRKESIAFICLLGGLLLFSGGYVITKHYSSNKYALTAVINPLSVMLQSPLNSPSDKSDLEKINKVLNLELVKKESSYAEVPSYWDGAVRADYAKYLGSFYPAYLDLVIHNPGEFINARMKTFIATNGLDPHTFNPTFMSLLSYRTFGAGSGTQEYKSSPVDPEVTNNFYSSNIGAKPLSYTLRYNISRALLMLDSSNHVSKLGYVVWTVIPTIGLLIILSVFFIIKRTWVLLGISILLLTHASLIFLSTPAIYFMYYLPIYLSGGVLIIICLMHLLKRFPAKVIKGLQNLR